jgi:hypothetical protein
MTPNRKNITKSIIGMSKHKPVALAMESTHDIVVTCADTPSAYENMRRAEQKLLKKAHQWERDQLRVWWDNFRKEFPVPQPSRRAPRHKHRKTSRDVRVRRR